MNREFWTATKQQTDITAGLLLFLFQFLLQAHEQLRVKEVLNRDAQAVAELFNCRYGRAAISAADYVVHCGLRHSAHAAQFVDGDVLLAAELPSGRMLEQADFLIAYVWHAASKAANLLEYAQRSRRCQC